MPVASDETARYVCFKDVSLNNQQSSKQLLSGSTNMEKT